MSDAAEISATLQDYLEAILDLAREKGAARVRDIAKVLSVHKSTVTAALKNLSEKGLVNYNPYEITTLTSEGRRIAEEITQKHRLIERFLREVLLMEPERARENACRMEHVVDREVLDRLVLFAQFVNECPRAGSDWIQQFAQFIRRGGKIYPDDSSAEQFLKDFKERLNKKRSAKRNKPGSGVRTNS